MVLEGPDAVRAARQVIGATDPLEARAGSIRGDFAIEMGAEHGPRLGLARVGRARVRRCSSASSSAPASRAAAASSPRPLPQRRAILERLGVTFTVRAAGRRRARAGRRRRRSRSRTRCARRARCARTGAREAVLGCDTLVDARRRDLRQARRRGRGPRDAARAERRDPRGRERARAAASAAARRRARATAIARTAVTLPRARRGAARLVPGDAASGAGGRAATRSRAPARRSCGAWTGDYENVVGLPLATLLDIYPELLSG